MKINFFPFFKKQQVLLQRTFSFFKRKLFNALLGARDSLTFIITGRTCVCAVVVPPPPVYDVYIVSYPSSSSCFFFYLAKGNEESDGHPMQCNTTAVRFHAPLVVVHYFSFFSFLFKEKKNLNFSARTDAVEETLL